MPTLLNELDELIKRQSKPKAKRHLTKITVDEISLVDRPAVPDAEFVIAKRMDADDEALLDLLTSDEAEQLSELAKSIHEGLHDVGDDLASMHATTTGNRVMEDLSALSYDVAMIRWRLRR